MTHRPPATPAEMRERADWLAARPSHALTQVISTGDMLRQGADAIEAKDDPRCPGCGESNMIEPIAGSRGRFYCHVCSRTWRHAAEANR